MRVLSVNPGRFKDLYHLMVFDAIKSFSVVNKAREYIDVRIHTCLYIFALIHSERIVFLECHGHFGIQIGFHPIGTHISRRFACGLF